MRAKIQDKQVIVGVDKKIGRYLNEQTGTIEKHSTKHNPTVKELKELATEKDLIYIDHFTEEIKYSMPLDCFISTVEFNSSNAVTEPTTHNQ
jgi:hypothetical protein